MTSKLEQAFLTYWIQLAPPQFHHLLEAEYQPLKTRKFRLDYALPTYRIGIELEGGIWASGRHTRGAGYSKDCEKYNLLALNQWIVLRFTSEWFQSRGKLSPHSMIGDVLALMETRRPIWWNG